MIITRLSKPYRAQVRRSSVSMTAFQLGVGFIYGYVIMVHHDAPSATRAIYENHITGQSTLRIWSRVL